jgi:TatD DNase family protein
MIDLHCHLDLYPDPASIVRKCRDRGIYVLSVTTTPKAWRGTLRLARDCPRIRTALGLHPQLAHERAAEIALFEGLLPEARYVGEIGLDGSPEFKAHWRIQSSVFDRALWATARAGGRVMSIHSRRATDEVLDALQAHPDAGLPVLHWFSGTKRQLERAIAMGCWFSVGPAMLRSKKGSELAAAMPRDRVVTETDGPFATTGQRLLEPSDVQSAASSLGHIWNDEAEVVEARLRNALDTLGTFARS